MWHVQQEDNFDRGKINILLYLNAYTTTREYASLICSPSFSAGGNSYRIKIASFSKETTSKIYFFSKGH